MFLEALKRRWSYLNDLWRDDPWPKRIGAVYGLIAFLILVRDEFLRTSASESLKLMKLLPLTITQWLLAGFFASAIWLFEAGFRFNAAAGAKLQPQKPPKTPEDERRFRAARALLPSNLDAVMDYAVASIRWLKSVREKAMLLEQDRYKTAVSVATSPRPDAVIDRLRDGVEHLDEPVSGYIGDLLKKIQVQRARIKWLEDYFETHMEQGGSRVGLARDVDQYLADSVEVAALARQLFPYARGENDNAPAPLDVLVLEAAFRECRLEVHQDVNAWNILSTPYLPKTSHYIDPEPDPLEAVEDM